MLILNNDHKVVERIVLFFPYFVTVCGDDGYLTCYDFCVEHYGRNALEFLSPRYLWLAQDRRWANGQKTDSGFVFLFRDELDAIEFRLFA